MASIFISGVSGPPCKAGCTLHVHADTLPSNLGNWGDDETNGEPINWTAQGTHKPLLYVYTLCDTVLTAEETTTHLCAEPENV